MIPRFCRAFLRLTGWKLVGDPPAVPKAVIIAAPHTSNWDFVFMMAMAGAFQLRMSWMGKAAIFRAPFGTLMRRLGGIPVQRDSSHNMVEQIAERFSAADQLLLAIPAEGTRAETDHWKSGFYHIASEANVPVVPSILDYGTKTGGFTPAITLTGDLGVDMDRIRAVYVNVVGKHPSRQGPVRLREETTKGPIPDSRDTHHGPE